MSAKKRMDDGIAAARALVAKGDFSGAAAVLDALTADPEIAALPAQTALSAAAPASCRPAASFEGARRYRRAGGLSVSSGARRPRCWPRCSSSRPPSSRPSPPPTAKPVPRVIHQIWIGSLPVPAGGRGMAAPRGGAGLCSIGCGKRRIWKRLGLPDQPVYAAMLARGDYPGAVDVARYAILAAEGGIYLDCDWYPARDDLSFHDLLPLIGLTAWAEDVPRQTGIGGLLLGNSFIAAPPDHPALHRLNRRACRRCWICCPKRRRGGPPGRWCSPWRRVAGRSAWRRRRLVAGVLPDRADYGCGGGAAGAGLQADGGLLIAWKSW